MGTSPRSGLRSGLDNRRADIEEPPHIALEEEDVGYAAQQSEGGTVIEHVSHRGYTVSVFKKMVVIEASKRAAYL